MSPVAEHLHRVVGSRARRESSRNVFLATRTAHPSPQGPPPRARGIDQHLFDQHREELRRHAPLRRQQGRSGSLSLAPVRTRVRGLTGITANVIAPGAVKTPGSTVGARGDWPEGTRRGEHRCGGRRIREPNSRRRLGLATGGDRAFGPPSRQPGSGLHHRPDDLRRRWSQAHGSDARRSACPCPTRNTKFRSRLGPRKSCAASRMSLTPDALRATSPALNDEADAPRRAPRNRATVSEGALLVAETATTRRRNIVQFAEWAVGRSSVVGFGLIHHASFNTLEENIEAARRAGEIGVRTRALLAYPPTFYPRKRGRASIGYTAAFCNAVEIWP